MSTSLRESTTSTTTTILATSRHISLSSTTISATTASSTSHDPTTVIVVVVTVVVVVVALLTLFTIWRRQGRRIDVQRSTLRAQLQSLTAVQEQAVKLLASTYGSRLPALTADFPRYELPRKHVVIGDTIGQGSFAIVHKGTLTRSPPAVRDSTINIVAIKVLKDVQNELACVKFLMEARLMSALTHPNIVALCAVCSQSMPMSIVTEVGLFGFSAWML
jgi:hypothetical protein